MLSFKDFTVVDLKPGEDEYIKYRAQKRKRGVLGGTIGGPVGESTESDSEVLVDEALDNTQRMKRKQIMRRLKARMKVGRERAKRKTASLEKLKSRAQKRARSAMFKKLAAGKDKSEMSYADRKNVEKRLESKKGVIDRMAKKLLPQVRKDEQARKQMAGKQK